MDEENYENGGDGSFTTIQRECDFYNVQTVGRPTKYDYEKFLVLFEEYKREYSTEAYLKLEKSHSESSHTSERSGDSTSESSSYDRRLYTKVPNESSFARYIGISTTTLDVYQNKYTEFKEIIKELLEFQKDFLLNGGISGRLNPLIVKLLLSKHGITEKTESEVKHTGTIDLGSFFDDTLSKKDNLVK